MRLRLLMARSLPSSSLYTDTYAFTTCSSSMQERGTNLLVTDTQRDIPARHTSSRFEVYTSLMLCPLLVLDATLTACSYKPPTASTVCRCYATKQDVCSSITASMEAAPAGRLTRTRA
jgi:hypothetical protein